MRLNIRKYYDIAFVSIEEGNTSIDLGTLDYKDLIKLQQEWQDSLEELNWIVNALAK